MPADGGGDGFQCLLELADLGCQLGGRQVVGAGLAVLFDELAQVVAPVEGGAADPGLLGDGGERYRLAGGGDLGAGVAAGEGLAGWVLMRF